MEKRGKRYEETECPFCSTKPGVCSYCRGTKKCTFCNGTGTRQTGSPVIATEGIGKASYEEKCPYCGGKGVCRYCEGTGGCWACDGTGKVESWDFYEKYQKLVGKKQAEEPTPPPPPAATDSASEVK
jgi:hypothetical protein